MALNLTTPIGVNFLSDWPSQNSVNCDDIDSYAGPCLTTHPIQTYTPALTASTTNPNLGTGGTLIGKYYKIFDQIYTWGEIRFGTGASIGSGVYRISLPFRAKTNISVGNPFTYPIPVGSGALFDTAIDTDRQPVTTMLGSPDFLVLGIRMGTAGADRLISHNIPNIWTGGSPGDGLMWSARYQREP